MKLLTINTDYPEYIQKAYSLYGKLIATIIDKGADKVCEIEEGLSEGTIEMTDLQLRFFENHKSELLRFGIESYLAERFPLKAFSGSAEQSFVAEEHGWLVTQDMPHSTAGDSLIGRTIKGFSSEVQKEILGAENCTYFRNVLREKQETVAIETLTIGFASGEISTEVETMEHDELWDYATSGGFDLVEREWAERQHTVVDEVTQSASYIYNNLYEN